MKVPAFDWRLSVLFKVIFKNKASRPYSFHLHGVYDRTLGAFMDQTHATSAPPGIPGEPVAPNEARTYNWKITKKQGPTDSEFDCKTGAYYSTVDKVCMGLCSFFFQHLQLQLGHLSLQHCLILTIIWLLFNSVCCLVLSLIDSQAYSYHFLQKRKKKTNKLWLYLNENKRSHISSMFRRRTCTQV